MMKRRRDHRSGYTIAEMLVVTAIASVIMLASFQLLDETVRVTLFIESRNDLPLIAQSAANSIQTALVQSRQVFDNDASANAVGKDYYDNLTTSGTDAPVDAVPPLYNDTGSFVPDTAAAKYTGNCLLLARQLSPITISYSGGTKTLFADRYRFEYFYLTQRTNSFKFGGSAVGYLDLMRGRSVEYADYFQLTNVLTTGADKKTVNTALIAANVKYAWNPGQPFAGSFFTLKSDDVTPYTAGPAKIDVATVKSLTPQVAGGRVFGKMNYSVGFKPTVATSFPIPARIPKYAIVDATKPLYPSGLEILAVGNATSRRILVRVVMMAHYRAQDYASQEASVITAPSR
jgi:prepilin-type N-terminal cleavage/methylation domain-containing protein